MKKFAISVDSCVDHYKSYIEGKDVYYIILKHIIGGVPYEHMYDSPEEYERFYESIRRGAMPTTSQLSPFEMQEYFERILQKEPERDIIHIPLSSGLSSTCDNAKAAAAKLNEGLSGRRIYVMDSLAATTSIALLTDRLIEMRDLWLSAAEAVKKLEYIRDRIQLWAIVGDLSHLRRGGRLSVIKATVGTILKIKPILIIDAAGKLTVECTAKGTKNAVECVLDKMKRYGPPGDSGFEKRGVYLTQTSAPETYAAFKEALLERYPRARIIKEGFTGPIIGTHVGPGTMAVVFEGKERLPGKKN